MAPQQQAQRCLALFRLLKPVRIRLRFGLVTLTKPSHGSLKPIDRPRELSLAKLRPHGLKDIDGRAFEVVICRSARSAELFEGAANLAHRSIKLFLRKFNRYRCNNTLCQTRYFGLYIEACIDHFHSLLGGFLPCPVLIRFALTSCDR